MLKKLFRKKSNNKPIYPAQSKAERLINHAQSQVEDALKKGNIKQLEYLITLIHLAYTYVELMRPNNRVEFFNKCAKTLREIYTAGNKDVQATTISSNPLAYFISYPRSGNTIVTQLTSRITQGQVFETMKGSMWPFSKTIYPEHYPYPRIIKDHRVLENFENDKCVLIVRDGRDTIVSLAYFTFKQGLHKFDKKDQIADFIYWVNDNYPYGSWAKHTSDLYSLSQKEDKLLVKYEEFLSSPSQLEKIILFFDENFCICNDQLEHHFKNRDSILQGIKISDFANKFWGIGEKFNDSSMFYEWSKTRTKSSWQQSWDSRAKKAFHETGATELLLKLGYETDENWWKN